MTYLKARDSEGQVLTARDVDEMATRTGHAGDEYTAWSLYQVDDSGESYAGYMIAGQFTSLDEIARQTADYDPVREDLERRGAEYGDPFAAYDERSSHEELAADHEPDLDELLADPEVAAEADRILAGEGGTILGIPFGPRDGSERGE